MNYAREMCLVYYRLLYYQRVNDESETCLVSVYRDLDLVTGHNLDVVVSLDYGDQITKST